MSVWAELRDAIRQAILLNERVERLSADFEKAQDRLIDHDRRLTRIETMIEVAQSRRLRSDH
ncbi:MAG: hypothetical protein ABI640_21415 [Gammaproteobacteria bacterium]